MNKVFLEKEKVSLHKLTHELKNPLTVCNGYLDMYHYTDEKTREKYLKIIQDEIKRSISIINSYKDKNKLNIEELDLIMLFEDIKNTLNNLFHDNNSEIIILDKDEIYIEGDYEKLKQVFINILKNSYEAKKNNEKLLIVIRTSLYKNNIVVTITDNGKGMSKEQLKRIYNEYYTTKKDGTGLGIPYIKEVILLHNGYIKYESKKFIGTRVSITIPKKRKSL